MRGYLRFGGRASRSEYWYFTLFWILVIGAAVALGIEESPTHPSGFAGGYPAAGLTMLFVILLPAILAVSARRLHDIGLSGWYYLLNAVPFGAAVFVVLTVLPGTKGWNEYGPDPLEFAAR